MKALPGIKIALRLRVLSSSPCRVAEGCTIFASSKDFKSPTVSQQSGRHFFVGALGGVSLSECQSSAPQCQRQCQPSGVGASVSVSAVPQCQSQSVLDVGASVLVSVSVSRCCLGVSLSQRQSGVGASVSVSVRRRCLSVSLSPASVPQCQSQSGVGASVSVSVRRRCLSVSLSPA